MSEYDKLTVVKLRDELVKRGLPKTGLKAALVQRLEEADAQPKGVESALGEAAATNAQPDEIQEETSTEQTTTALTSNGTGEGTNNDAPPIPQNEEKRDAETVESDDANGEQGRMEGENDILQKEEHHVQTATNLSSQGNDTEAPTEDHETQHEVPSSNAPEATIEVVRETEPAPQLPISSETQSDQNTMISTAGTEELLEDSRKRKRRSQSPPPSSIETQKRLKADKTGPPVELPEDATMQEGAPSIKYEHAPSSNNTPLQNETLKSNGHALSRGGGPVSKYDGPAEIVASSSPKREPTQVDSVESPIIKTSQSDTRFKNLFTAPSKVDSSSHQPPPADTEDRIIGPAIHSATSALYIRELMRPLKPESIKEHLVALATPPDSAVEPSIVTSFFLDSIRTHCLVGFQNIAAASRVRSGLHDRIWPNERDRRPLYVDFVPEEKLKTWIDVEQNAPSGRGHPQKRWEVVYEDERGEIKAYLQEVGTNAGGAQAVQPTKADAGQGVVGAPSGPRIRESEPRGVHPRPDNGKGFQALDDLFKSTVAKPKLYYQPVVKATADQRLERLAAGRGRGRNDEMRRYTFEDDVLVDKAPEFGNRGGGRGGYGGRGAFPGSYRGRGSAYRGDEYRGRVDSWRDRRSGY